MYDNDTPESNFGEFEIDFSGSAPSYYYFRDIGIDICVSSREEIGNLRKIWNESGIYILVGDDPEFDYRFYVGLSSGLSDRINSHVKNKDFWKKVIIIKRSYKEGFTKSDIFFLESEVYKQLKLWKNAKVENSNQLDEDSITFVQKSVNHRLLYFIFNFLDHLGIKERLIIDEEDNIHENSSQNKYWCVRSGKGGSMLSTFRDEGFIAIDFRDSAPTTLENLSKDDIKQSEVSGNATGQLLSFRDLMDVGDYIISPEPGSQEYSIFKITSNYYFKESDMGFSHRRKVEYIKNISKEDLSDKLARSLRTILTVFKPSDTSILDALLNAK
jgi:hypothetical protein